MAEETKGEETKPDEAEDEKSEPAADEAQDEPKDEESDEKSEDDESEHEAVEPAEEMGAMSEKFGVAQPPAIPDTVFVPASFARDGVTPLKAAGVQYLRADHFGRAAILHSDRVNAAALPARPTYADRMLVDGDLNFVPVIGSGANNPTK